LIPSELYRPEPAGDRIRLDEELLAAMDEACDLAG